MRSYCMSGKNALINRFEATPVRDPGRIDSNRGHGDRRFPCVPVVYLGFAIYEFSLFSIFGSAPCTFNRHGQALSASSQPFFLLSAIAIGENPRCVTR